MSVPGGVGGMNSVGAIYVSVLTDTSRMKGEIEDAAGDAGQSGSVAFEKAWYKEQQKSANGRRGAFIKWLGGGDYKQALSKLSKEFDKTFSATMFRKINAGAVVEIDDASFVRMQEVAKQFGTTWDQVFAGAVARSNTRLLERWGDQVEVVDANFSRLFRNTRVNMPRLNKQLSIASASTAVWGTSTRSLSAVFTGLTRSATRTGSALKQAGSSWAQANLNIENIRHTAEGISGAFRFGVYWARQLAFGFRLVGNSITTRLTPAFRMLRDNMQLVRVGAQLAGERLVRFGRQAARPLKFLMDEVAFAAKNVATGLNEMFRITPALRQVQRFVRSAGSEALFATRNVVRGVQETIVGQSIDIARNAARKFYDTYVDKQYIAETAARARRAARLIGAPFVGLNNMLSRLRLRLPTFRDVVNQNLLPRFGGRDGIEIPASIDPDVFRLSVLRSAEEIEKTITPAVKNALIKGQKVDWTFNQDAFDEVDRLAKYLNVEMQKAADSVSLTLADKFKQEMRDIKDERNLEFFDSFRQKTNKLTVGLFRAGGSGPFGIFTSVLGLFVGAFTTVFNLITAIPKAIGKVGDVFMKFGEGIAKVFGAAGKVVGGFISSIGRGLMSLAKSPITLAIAAVAGILGGLKAINFIAKAFVGAMKTIAGAVVLLGGVLYYTAAAAVILGPALVALGAAGLAGYLGMKDTLDVVSSLNQAISSGAEEDWKKYNEQLGKLGKNARTTVQALEPFLRSLKEIRGELEEKIFAGIGEQISSFKGKLGPIRTAFVNLGDGINNAFKAMFDVFGQESFLKNIETLLTNAKPMIENFGAAIANVVAGIASVFATISPLAVTFSESLLRGSQSFATWAEENKEPILGFFTRAYEVASQVWDIIWELIKIAASLFGATYDETAGPQGMLATISNKLTGIKTWLDENPDAIGRWFEDSRSTINEVGGLITTVKDGLASLDSEEVKEAINNVIGLINGIAGAINAAIGAWDKLKRTVSSPLDVAQGNTKPGQEAGVSGLVTQLRNSLRGLASPGRAAGGFIAKPELSWIGEAGPELVVPLKRPMHMIDPAARPAARMLQGKGKDYQHSTGPQKVVNLTQNITPIQSDPHAIASSVVNRAVAVARG